MSDSDAISGSAESSGAQPTGPAHPIALLIVFISIGAALLFGTMVLAVLSSTPSPGLAQLMRIAGACAALLVAGAGTGFLHIDGKVGAFAVKGGGSFAVFILVFLLDPARQAAFVGQDSDRKDNARQADSSADALAGNNSVSIVDDSGQTRQVSGKEAADIIAKRITGMSLYQAKLSASDEQLEALKRELSEAKTRQTITLPPRMDLRRIPVVPSR